MKAMAEEVAKLALQQLQMAMKKKNIKKIQQEPCQFSCDLRENTYGLGQYCPTLMQKSPQEIKELTTKKNVTSCSQYLTP